MNIRQITFQNIIGLGKEKHFEVRNYIVIFVTYFDIDQKKITLAGEFFLWEYWPITNLCEMFHVD